MKALFSTFFFVVGGISLLFDAATHSNDIEFDVPPGFEVEHLIG